MGALEIMGEAHNQGMDLYNLPSGLYSSEGEELRSSTVGVHLQEELCGLILSKERTDDFYYSLIDITRQNIPVPGMAINAVIVSAAKIGQVWQIVPPPLRSNRCCFIFLVLIFAPH